MSRAPTQRLADMADAIARIRVAVEAMHEAEEAGDALISQIAFDAILYRLLVIGEAVKALPPDLLALEQAVPWTAVARFRDVLAHRYFHVDSEIVHRTVDLPLADLEKAVTRLSTT